MTRLHKGATGRGKTSYASFMSSPLVVDERRLISSWARRVAPEKCNPAHVEETVMPGGRFKKILVSRHGG